MNVAIESLDRGVHALFMEPELGLSTSLFHPLCDCMSHQPPPPDWRHLARFPVLKRHVLSKFRSVAVEMAKVPQTPRKRRKRISVQQSGDVDEYKALCLASFCQKLAQCKLLIVAEAELMEIVVKLESLDILRRVISGKLLSLRMRILLLSFALRKQGIEGLKSAVQTWIQEVSEKVLEEILEATATGGSSKPTRKRARTRLNEKEKRETIDKCCEFCRYGANTASLKVIRREWDFLVKCSQEIAKILESNGEIYPTNKAMIALAAFWDLQAVARMSISGKADTEMKRSRSLVGSEEIEWPSMSVAAYEQLCHKVLASSAETLGPMNRVFQKMWISIWKRELNNVVKAGQVVVTEAIHHCSKADAFTSVSLLSGVKKTITHYPGFRIVMEYICSSRVDISNIVAAFANLWSLGHSGVLTQVTVPCSVVTLSTKQILRSYLSELLQSTKVRFKVEPSSSLKLLFALYKVFSDFDPTTKQHGKYIQHWDVLMSRLGSETSAQALDQDGRNWCLFLERCVLDVNVASSAAMCSCNHFLQAFKVYCLNIMLGVIATGDKIISSGGAIQRQLVCVEGDRSVARRVLAQMITTFGEEWTSSLIAQLLRASTQLRSTGENNQRGIRNLLFPGLVAGMKSTSKANPKRRKTGQQLFTSIIHAVNANLKESESTPLYLVALMRFCEAWDNYQSTHTKEPPTKANRWGFRAMVDLDMLPELLMCYDKADVVRQETKGTLVFAAEVIQNIPVYPQTLEKMFFKVLSDIKAGVEHVKTSIAHPEDAQLVSHSSALLQRLLKAIKSADIAQTRVLLTDMSDTAGTLRELRQQFEQWFSFVEVYGACFAGKESRLELSILCTRLIRWFPDTFGSMRYVLMTPLDSHFVFALKLFVKDSANGNSQDCPILVDSPSLPSAVRVEMGLHLYLTAAVFPDLKNLTVLLTKAIVKCHSPDTFSDLTKIARKNNRVLLAEAAVGTLSFPLRGLEFSTTASIQQDEGSHGIERKKCVRRAKSLIYQENTFKLLADSASIFDEGIAWSVLLFDETSSITWLPYFFEYILKTEFCEGAVRVDLLLTTLEKLVLNGGGKELRWAYWLAALLNTALITCSRRNAGANADVDIDLRDRLRQITGKVLQLQEIALETSKMQNCCRQSDTLTSCGGKVLGLVQLSKCAMMSIDEKEALWTGEHRLDDTSYKSFEMSVSDVWKAGFEGSPEIAMEPPIQLFLPFGQWLSGALIYSQSFLEDPSPVLRRWERTFTSYVTDLYLPIEFNGATCDLLKAWLTTWITCNLARGQDDGQLLALLPSQVALFRRLSLASSRGVPQSRGSTSIWQLLFIAINLAFNQYRADSGTRFEQATELVVSTLTTLELVELSASSDFTINQDIEPFFNELDTFLSRPELRECNVDPVCCLLQYPLEVLACCYACKIPAESVVESQLFLQRTKTVLEGTSILDIDALSSKATDMNAFLQYWKDEMLLKYDYIDQERCVHVLEVIQSTLH